MIFIAELFETLAPPRLCESNSHCASRGLSFNRKMNLGQISIPTNYEHHAQSGNGDSLGSASTLVDFDSGSDLDCLINRKKFDTEINRELRVQYSRMHEQSVCVTRRWIMVEQDRKNAISQVRISLMDAQAGKNYLNGYIERVNNLLAQKRFDFDFTPVLTNLIDSQMNVEQVHQLQKIVRERIHTYIYTEDDSEQVSPKLKYKLSTNEGLLERIQFCELHLLENQGLISDALKDIEIFKSILTKTKGITAKIKLNCLIFTHFLDNHENSTLQTASCPIDYERIENQLYFRFFDRTLQCLDLPMIINDEAAIPNINSKIPFVEMLIFILIATEFLIGNMNLKNAL